MNQTASTATKMTVYLPETLPRYPLNLKLRWRLAFMAEDAWWTLRHLHEYRIVHKSRVQP